MNKRVIENLKRHFSDVTFENDIYTIRINGNGFDSDVLRKINNCSYGIISNFKTEFDLDNDTTIVKVELNRNTTLFEYYGYNQFTKNYNLIYNIEDVDSWIEDFDVKKDLSEEDKVEILNEVLDSDYIGETIRSVAHEYLISKYK